MPTLKKARKEPIRQVNKENRYQIYQSAKWKKLRSAKLMSQPLCEICLEKGLVTPAIDVHHKDSFTNYSGAMRLYKAYSFDNLLSVCKKCHSELHINGTTHG